MMVDSSEFSLKAWEWISIPLVDDVIRSLSPLIFFTSVVFPALAHPITIALPLYTEMFPSFILLTNFSLFFRFQLRISCGISTVKSERKKLFKGSCVKSVGDLCTKTIMFSVFMDHSKAHFSLLVLKVSIKFSTSMRFIILLICNYFQL